MEFFAIFFGIYGLIAMAVIMVILLAMGVAVSLEQALVYLFLFFVAYVAVRVIWFWTCRGLAHWLKKGSRLQLWFENEFLDMKYPSRVRRRKNQLNKQSGQ